jgi:hypothetical protein
MGNEVPLGAYREDGNYLSSSHSNGQRNSSYEGSRSSLPRIDSPALHIAREHEHTCKLLKALSRRPT